jgi:peptide/nickel transport system substrate-binding protein
MQKRSRGVAAGVGLAVLALVAAACGGSSSSTGSSSGSGSIVASQQGLNPGSGTPKKGGTLNMLGTGDVTYLDYNISYYSVDYQVARLWQRDLYDYPAIPGKTTEPAPDLATAPPTVSNGGKTYSVTIRTGADWNTKPARQITAADAVRGIERSCNPVQPFGGLPDFETLIVGYQAFCTGFAKAKPTVAGLKSYMDSHQISGVKASGQTITYTLAHPASYFPTMLTLDSFAPAPVESLNYLPASAASAQHTIANGPYQVSSYTPTRQITFVRNPAWKASSDPIRKAYVDKVVINETGNENGIQQQLQTNTASAGMDFGTFPPIGAVPGLYKQMQQGLTHNFTLGSSFSNNPYFVFNQVSPNNGGALKKVAVRQALSYGIDRTHLTSDLGGPIVSPPLTHILPPGINGSQDLPKNYNPYPYNPSKAKSMLAAAGYANKLTLTVLYNATSTTEPKIAQTLQSDLGKVGVKIKLLPVPAADLYGKYLTQPTPAKQGVWDIAMSGWSPDWYGDAAVSFFGPLFSGKPSFPPNGSNFGFYDNPAVNALIGKGASAASASAAATIWAQADEGVMKDAVIYPMTYDNVPLYHASYVHNAVYIAGLEGFDPANIWLSSPGG